jgi:hypothetical protein
VELYSGGMPGKIKVKKQRSRKQRLIDRHASWLVRLGIGGLAVLVVALVIENQSFVLGKGSPRKPAPTTAPTPTPISVYVPIPPTMAPGAPSTVVTIPNYSFEIDSDNDKMPDGWFWMQDRMRVGNGLVCNSASDGSCSFRVVAWSSKQQTIHSEKFPVPPTWMRRVKLTIDSRPIGATDKGFIAVNLFAGDKMYVGSSITLTGGTSDTFITSSQMPYFSQGPYLIDGIDFMLGYQISHNGNNTGSFDFDNIRVEFFPE